MVINANDLKNSANHRRKYSSSHSGWQCSFCKRSFSLEKAFMTHQCKEKKRNDEIKTPIGQAAYTYYTDWMRQKKLKAPSIDTFTSSRFYTSFIKFSEHVNKLNITHPVVFIKLMILRDIPPVMWCRDQCYSIYLEWVDKESDPFQLVLSSLDLLEKIATQQSVKLGTIFQHLGYKHILELIRLRNISPWLLLHSGKFKEFLKDLDQEDMSIILGIINVTYWSDVLAQNAEISKELVEIVKQFGL
jgi:hypothetical protein